MNGKVLVTVTIIHCTWLMTSAKVLLALHVMAEFSTPSDTTSKYTCRTVEQTRKAEREPGGGGGGKKKKEHTKKHKKQNKRKKKKKKEKKGGGRGGGGGGGRTTNTRNRIKQENATKSKYGTRPCLSSLPYCLLFNHLCSPRWACATACTPWAK